MKTTIQTSGGPVRFQSVEEATINQLRAQRDALLKKVSLLSAIVREVPSLIVSARLDVREGKQTKYNYNRHDAALNAKEF